MYKKEVYGKGCIVARIVADSVAENSGTRITTFELEYPRFIHSELMTHRMFSRNAMSSRAVPIGKMIEQVQWKPAMPIEFGKNQAGMQAKEIITEHPELHYAMGAWIVAAKEAAKQAKKMDKLGLHKQIVNRVLEPFQIMKTVVTATEWNNWWYLRDHEDAQPEIAELAKVMRKGYQGSEPEVLKPGEWHTPYVDHFRASDGDAFLEYHTNGIGVAFEEALKVSASCCAQVSFRQSDTSIEKAKRIYDRLVESKPVHASPFEHAATPMQFYRDDNCGWEDGVTHSDIGQDCWSGNFKHWVQYRQLIEGHVVW